MNTTKRTYESLYIVDATNTDEQLDAIIAKYSKVITDGGGEVRAAGKWDTRRLAYEIKGRREGTYILMFFEAEPAVAKELDRVFRISDEVIRHIILKIEPKHIDTARLEAQAARGAEEVSEEVEVESVEETVVEEGTELEAAAEEAEATAVETDSEPAAEEPVVEEDAAEDEQSAEAEPAQEERPESDETEETEAKAE